MTKLTTYGLSFGKIDNRTEAERLEYYRKTYTPRYFYKPFYDDGLGIRDMPLGESMALKSKEHLWPDSWPEDYVAQTMGSIAVRPLNKDQEANNEI